jgi:hypothetical protein
MVLTPEEMNKSIINGQILSADDDFEEIDEDSAAELLQELLKPMDSVYHLLCYMSDPLLARTITNRERKLIDRLLEKIHPLLERAHEIVE